MIGVASGITMVAREPASFAASATGRSWASERVAKRGASYPVLRGCSDARPEHGEFRIPRIRSELVCTVRSKAMEAQPTLDRDDLLRHAKWIRQLAVELVFDPS